MPNRGKTIYQRVPDDRWPYPDPDRPGVFRLPLDGRGKREALLDADALPLVLGRRWCWCPGPRRTRGYAYRSDTRRGAVKLAREVAGITDRKTTRSTADGRTSSSRRAPARPVAAESA